MCSQSRCTYLPHSRLYWRPRLDNRWSMQCLPLRQSCTCLRQVNRQSATKWVMLVTFLLYTHVAQVVQMFAAEEASAGYSARQQKLHQQQCWQQPQYQLLLNTGSGREQHMKGSIRKPNLEHSNKQTDKEKQESNITALEDTSLRFPRWCRRAQGNKPPE